MSELTVAPMPLVVEVVTAFEMLETSPAWTEVDLKPPATAVDGNTVAVGSDNSVTEFALCAHSVVDAASKLAVASVVHLTETLDRVEAPPETVPVADIWAPLETVSLAIIVPGDAPPSSVVVDLKYRDSEGIAKPPESPVVTLPAAVSVCIVVNCT